MQSWHEPVVIGRPLSDVRLVAHRSAQEEMARRMHECERASYERGRHDGEQGLSEQLLQQRGEMLELQNGILDSLQQSIPLLTRACEKELIELAVEVARKLVASLPITSEMIEGVIQEALAQVEDSANYTVVLHPEDLALLQRVNSPLCLPSAGVDRICFKAAESVGRGGCLVHTRFGTVDAQRETKVELIKKALFA